MRAFFCMIPPRTRSTLFPYTTLFRSGEVPADRAEPLPRLRRVQPRGRGAAARSEEHTSELQSHSDLVCRLLLEKKKRSSPPPSCPTVHRCCAGCAGTSPRHAAETSER